MQKKRPMPFKPGKNMAPASMPTEGTPVDVERKGAVEGSVKEEKVDERQSSRKSRQSVI